VSPTDIVVVLSVILLAVLGWTSGTWQRELKAISGQLTVYK
jgi:hypothetical protein